MGKTREELVDLVANRIEKQTSFSLDTTTARRRARRILDDLDDYLVVDAEPDTADVG